MSNTVRLVNGGTIQVRTGVLQGIGPVGPRGVAGPQGADGPAGPIGEQGVQGQILEMQSLTRVASANPITANTDTVIAFGNMIYDTVGCIGPSSSQITLSTPGDYMLSLWLEFAAATATKREVWFAVGGTTIARKSAIADTGAFFLDLSFPYRVLTGPDVVSVMARSAVATSVAIGGSVAVNRIGSGPPGAAGPVGPQGPIGATGAVGPAGPSGTANSGFTKYADLLPH
jgi:hypothetical protein